MSSVIQTPFLMDICVARNVSVCSSSSRSIESANYSTNRGVQDALRRYEYDKRLLSRISVHLRLMPVGLTSLASVLMMLQWDFLPIKVIDADYHSLKVFQKIGGLPGLAWSGHSEP